MKLILLASIILAANALSATQHWENFKVTYNKSYKTTVEDSIRYNIFLQNVGKINEHNARYARGEETYTLGVNKFADLTEEEFSKMLKLQTKNMPKKNGNLHEFPEGLEVPDAIDWRTEGAVVEVKDQGYCGSSWAFSSTGALEGQNYILNGVSLSLSEQQLLDCSGDYGFGDCYYFGIMDAAFEYVMDYGIESEEAYPYVAQKRTCKVETGSSVLSITGYKDIVSTEEALLTAVGTIGPISVAIYAEPIQFYSKGIFSSPCNELYVDHGALAVGYGEEDGTPFWIVKNSWGAEWGEDGYFRLARGSDLCGIAQLASYPVL